MIPTPRMLSAALGGYMLTGDPQMAEVAEQYCKGITATMLGMVHDQDDPIDWLPARNIATISHTYQTQEGYTKEIDYTGWHYPYEHWNTCRFEYPDNPYWGSVWVTKMRSKDDVPHLFMAVPFLAYAAERAGSAYGYPLTSQEARLIHTYWGTGVDEYSAWEYWDLWAPEHEDGQLPIRPGDGRDEERWTGIEDMVLPLEYCWSPLKNPAGARFVDCDIVGDPASW